AVDREEELGVVPTGVEALVDEVEVDPAEPELAELLDRVHHVTREARGVVDDDQVKRTRGGQGRLDEPREPAPSLDADAADGLVRVDVLVEDQPVRVARRLLAAVADLVR